MNRKPYLRIFPGVFAIALVCLAIGFLSSCGGSSNSNITPPPIIAIAANSGYTTSAVVGSPFGTLSATVTSNGSPASGVSVTFTAPSSGASGLFATTTPGLTDTETTNASGIATSKIFTANSTAGAYTVAASATGAITPASFALTNTATAPPTITIAANSGYTTSAAVDSSFGTFSATVTSDGSPASGISVTFTAPSSGASGLFATATPALTDTETTNASGIATSQIFTANSTPGAYAVTASTSGATTSASFALTNTSTPPPTIVITATSGSNQSAQVGTAFAAPLVANVISNGTALSGATVTFAVPSTGASCALSATTATTDASGNASVTCTANTTAGGPYNVTASTSGATTSASFALTNTATVATTLTATSGEGQSATVSTAFALPLVATATDAHGSPVSGVSVTFTAPASGVSGTFATTPPSTIDIEVTGTNGQATSKTFTANSTVGLYDVVASSGTLTQANFAETNTAAPATTLTATSGGGQSATVSTAFTLPLVATATDAHGNPVSGVSVTFTAPASGASGLFATTPPATTDTEVTGTNGQATSKIFTANSTAGGPYNVVASSGSLTPVNFSETNTAIVATTLTATSGGGQTTTVSTPFALPLVATVTDSHGNPVSGVSVTFTAPASGASGLFQTTPPSITDTEVTGSNGQATSRKYGANQTAGTYNVVASSAGLTSVNFSETNTAGAAGNLTATSGGGQSAAINTAFALPLVATVTDGHGNPVSGVSVTFTAPASGASGTFATVPPSTTDTEVTATNGQAVSHVFTANSTAGGYNVVASSGTLTSVNFAETNTGSSSGTLTATSGAGQSAIVSTAFTLPLVATATDSHGNPLSGVSVTFTAPASGASGLFATTPPSITDTEITGSNGQATSQIFGANSTAGSYTVVASSSGLTSANFAETNTAGAAANLTATSGGGQSAKISTAFTLPLVATVTDAHSNPVSGVSVTFTAPASGASGLFATTPPAITDTEVTGTNGQATSQIFTANSTAGGPYNVVASSGSLTPVNFAETNTTGTSTSSTYVFYASGEDTFEGWVNYYAIAGAVTIDSTGNVIAGEQDYNDAFGATSLNEPTPDIITGGTLAVDPTTGQGTLTLTTNNTVVGSPAGTEVFAVQFANTKHALIAEFDGWATSSGSMDLQTATTASGNFAFTLSGVDSGYNSVALGGVYNLSGGTANGTLDVNDDGTVMTGVAFTSTATTPDAFGRSTVTGITNPVTVTPIILASYVVGPEAVRLIDIDTGAITGETTQDAAVGSAYGQGSATFTNASLTSGVFTMLGQWSEAYATLGQFNTDSNGNITSGVADDNELNNGVQVEAASIVNSTYNLVATAANGYGSINLNWNGTTPTPNVTTLGVYMVDPNLNINDPNNTTDLGGALVIDLDAALPGGMGVITPQTNPAVASFNGTYVAGFQDFNNYFTCPECEFDTVSQGTMTAGVLSLTGDASDPIGTWYDTPAESTGDTFTSTPQPDTNNLGRYSMQSTNTTPNPLATTINSLEFDLNVDIYQASGTTLYWLGTDSLAVFLGPIEQQGDLTGIPAVKKPAAKAQPNHTKNLKPKQRLGGTLH